MQRTTRTARRNEQTNALSERVKELNCLYDIARLFYRQDLDLAAVLRELVDIIPRAWQHSETCRVCLVLDGQATCTAGFRATDWVQEEAIHIAGERAGTIRICYLEERPECDEGPFLREERSLLRTIARHVEEIAERRRAEHRILLYQEQLQSLARETTRADARERRTIARELHDSVGQTLAALRIKVSMLARSQADPALRAQLDEIGGLVGQSMAATRTLLFDISTPVLDEFGLLAALEWLVEQNRERFGLEVEFVPRGEVDPLPEELRATLFRAARELLVNVAKHAGTTRARLHVARRDDVVRVSVADDGIGFDARAAQEGMLRERSFGLFSMREQIRHQGGRLRVRSRRGRGTRVVVTVPAREASG